MGSVRGCGVEPYDEDFFAIDRDLDGAGTGVYYLRHRVLFNLYNFAGGVGVQPTRHASLEIKNCTFEYLFRDYEALVYVENNNMQIQNHTAGDNPDDPKNLMIYGDDRGANIIIKESTFKNSRFCKGLIVYESLPDLESSSNTIINLAKEFHARYPYDIDKDSLPEVTIQDSSFYNLNLFSSIRKLSYGEKNSTISGMSSVAYPYVDNHGSVVNLRGYPGQVNFYNNTIEKNFAHIAAVRTQREEATELLNFADFEDSTNGQLYTCANGKRLLSQYLTSYFEQPSETLNQLETYSPIFISANEGPMIFIDNVF